MNSRNRDSTRAPRDPDMVGAEAAMHRAARLARRRAEAAASAAGVSSRATEATSSGESRRDPRALTFSRAQAYEIDEGQPPTIVPAVTPEEGRAVVEALQTLRATAMDSAALHLRNASERINSGDWAGSVRESIHAVESVARQLDPDASTTLGPALASIEKHGTLHPALRDALEKLYGYTSDEQGVRHVLLDRADHNVGRDEAVFMLGACASFASFLWRKHAEGSTS